MKIVKLPTTYQSRFSTGQKVIALLVGAAFCLNDLGFAQGSSSGSGLGMGSGPQPVWVTYQDAAAARGTTQDVPDLGFTVPKVLGLGRDSHLGRGDETIIQIQDAHGSLGAQERIAGILDSLVQNYELKTIALEGSVGEIDTSVIRSFPDPNVRERFARTLLAEGGLNAGEFFSILSRETVDIFGVEDPDVYSKDLEHFQNLHENRRRIRTPLNRLHDLTDKLKQKLYPENLQKLLTHSLLAEDGQLTLTDKWAVLQGIARELGMALETYPNLKQLAAVNKLEDIIDFKSADGEREVLIEVLNQILDPDHLRMLVLKSLAFKSGEISEGAYHLWVSDLASRHELPAENYPNLARYSEYLVLFENMNLPSLFTEAERFEKEAVRLLLQSEKEREFYELAERISIFEDLLKGTLSSQKYGRYLARTEEMTREHFDHLLSRYAREAGIDYGLKEDLKALFGYLPEAAAFYDLALKRDQALVGNTLKRMQATDSRVAALVTGGFHTEGIVDLIRSQNLSYLVIMPKFEEKDKERPYITILSKRNREEFRPLRSDYVITLGTVFDTALRGSFYTSREKTERLELYIARLLAAYILTRNPRTSGDIDALKNTWKQEFASSEHKGFLKQEAFDRILDALPAETLITSSRRNPNALTVLVHRAQLRFMKTRSGEIEMKTMPRLVPMDHEPLHRPKDRRPSPDPGRASAGTRFATLDEARGVYDGKFGIQNFVEGEFPSADSLRNVQRFFKVDSQTKLLLPRTYTDENCEYLCTHYELSDQDYPILKEGIGEFELLVSRIFKEVFGTGIPANQIYLARPGSAHVTVNNIRLPSELLGSPGDFVSVSDDTLRHMTESLRQIARPRTNLKLFGFTLTPSGNFLALFYNPDGEFIPLREDIHDRMSRLIPGVARTDIIHMTIGRMIRSLPYSDDAATSQEQYRQVMNIIQEHQTELIRKWEGYEGSLQVDKVGFISETTEMHEKIRNLADIVLLSPADISAPVIDGARTVPPHHRVDVSNKGVKIEVLGGDTPGSGSGILLKLPDKTALLLDLGIGHNKVGPDADAVLIKALGDHKLVGAFITHAHIDHSAGAPYFHKAFPGVPLISSETSSRILPVLWNDSVQFSNSPYTLTRRLIKEAMASMIKAKTGVWYSVTDTIKIYLNNAEHIHGAVSIHVSTPFGDVQYTGDTSNHGPVSLTANDILPPGKKPNVLIIESTNGAVVFQKSIQERRAELIDEAKEAFGRRGSLIIPAFSVGRSTEVAAILKKAYSEGLIPKNAKIYLDGMSREIALKLADDPLLEGLEDFFEGGVYAIKDERHRQEIIQEVHLGDPRVLIAGHGMLNGGLAVRYMEEFAHDRRHKFIFVGYQAPGTLGKQILDSANPQEAGSQNRGFEVAREDQVALKRTGKRNIKKMVINADVRYIPLSAHGDQNELAGMITGVDADAVLLTHGDPDARRALKRHPDLTDVNFLDDAEQIGTVFQLDLEDRRNEFDEIYGTSLPEPGAPLESRSDYLRETFIDEWIKRFTDENLIEVHSELIPGAGQFRLDDVDRLLTSYFRDESGRSAKKLNNTLDQIHRKSHRQRYLSNTIHWLAQNLERSEALARAAAAPLSPDDEPIGTPPLSDLEPSSAGTYKEAKLEIQAMFEEAGIGTPASRQELVEAYFAPSSDTVDLVGDVRHVWQQSNQNAQALWSWMETVNLFMNELREALPNQEAHESNHTLQAYVEDTHENLRAYFRSAMDIDHAAERLSAILGRHGPARTLLWLAELNKLSSEWQERIMQSAFKTRDPLEVRVTLYRYFNEGSEILFFDDDRAPEILVHVLEDAETHGGKASAFVTAEKIMKARREARSWLTSWPDTDDPRDLQQHLEWYFASGVPLGIQVGKLRSFMQDIFAGGNDAIGAYGSWLQSARSQIRTLLNAKAADPVRIYKAVFAYYAIHSNIAGIQTKINRIKGILDNEGPKAAWQVMAQSSAGTRVTLTKSNEKHTLGYLRDMAVDPSQYDENLGEIKYKQIPHVISPVLYVDKQNMNHLKSNLEAIRSFKESLPETMKVNPTIVIVPGQLMSLMHPFDEEFDIVVIRQSRSDFQSQLQFARDESRKTYRGTTITMMLNGSLQYERETLLGNLRRLINYRNPSVVSSTWRSHDRSFPLDFTFYTDSFVLGRDQDHDLFRNTFPYLVFGTEVPGKGNTSLKDEWESRTKDQPSAPKEVHINTSGSAEGNFLPRDQKVLVLEAHPDDAVMSGATLLKRLLLRGNEVTVLGMTTMTPPRAIYNELTDTQKRKVLQMDLARQNENHEALDRLSRIARSESDDPSRVKDIEFIPSKDYQFVNRGLTAYFEDGAPIGRSRISGRPTEKEKGRLLAVLDRKNPDLIIIPAFEDDHDGHVKIHVFATEVIDRWAARRRNKNRKIRTFELPHFSASFETFDANAYILQTPSDTAQKDELLRIYESQAMALSYDPEFVAVQRERVKSASKEAYTRARADLNLKDKFSEEAILLREVVYASRETWAERVRLWIKGLTGSRLPVDFLLEAMGLSADIPFTGREEIMDDLGITVKYIRIPERADPLSVPRGIEILDNELAPARDFRLVYRKDRLIAVMPVITRDLVELLSKKPLLPGAEDRGVLAHYFDFSEYYIRELPRYDESWDEEGVREDFGLLADQSREDQTALELYRRRLTNEEHPIWSSISKHSANSQSWIYAEITGQGSNTHIRIRNFGPGELDDDAAWNSFKKVPGRHQIIIPLYPSVYNPSMFEHHERRTLKAIYSDPAFNVIEGHRVLVVGPGAGIDTWVAWLKARNKIHTIGINPLEIANTKLLAEIAGFDVEGVVNDGIVDSDGQPVYGSKRFDRVIWDTPFIDIHTSPQSVPRRRLWTYWDHDRQGVQLKRFMQNVGRMMYPLSRGLLLNVILMDDETRSDIVKSIIEGAGEEGASPPKQFEASVDMYNIPRWERDPGWYGLYTFQKLPAGSRTEGIGVSKKTAAGSRSGDMVIVSANSPGTVPGSRAPRLILGVTDAGDYDKARELVRELGLGGIEVHTLDKTQDIESLSDELNQIIGARNAYGGIIFDSDLKTEKKKLTLIRAILNLDAATLALNPVFRMLLGGKRGIEDFSETELKGMAEEIVTRFLPAPSKKIVSPEGQLISEWGAQRDRVSDESYPVKYAKTLKEGIQAYIEEGQVDILEDLTTAALDRLRTAHVKDPRSRVVQGYLDEAIRAQEDILEDLLLKIYHPSFLYDIRRPVMTPKAIIWTWQMVLNDPYFFKVLEDRDKKLDSGHLITDYVVLPEGLSPEDARSRLEERRDDFERRFKEDQILTSDRLLGRLTTLGVYQYLNDALGKEYESEDIVFVDEWGGEGVTDVDDTLLIVKLDGSPLQLDKVLVEILAVGGKIELLHIPGLERTDKKNIIRYRPLMPADYEYRFRLHRRTGQTTQAAT